MEGETFSLCLLHSLSLSFNQQMCLEWLLCARHILSHRDQIGPYHLGRQTINNDIMLVLGNGKQLKRKVLEK